MKTHNSILKILSFGFGLAVSLTLIAKVCFDLSYDTFYTGYNRIYRIKSNVSRGEGDKSFGQVSGAVAPGFKEWVPGVEAATRVTGLWDSDLFYVDEERNTLVEGASLIADTSFFKVFDRPILAGDPQTALGEVKSCMVSRSFADKIGGVEAAMGRKIANKDSEVYLVINGVYEDFPDNGSFHCDVLVSMTSYYKGSYENWVGNDRYIGFVKLYEGVDAETLTDAIHLMQEKNQPLEDLEKKNGVRLWYTLESLRSYFLSNKTERTMLVLLSVVALILLLVSTLNYGLVVVSDVIKRSREIGVRKCFGAEGRDIVFPLFKEAATDFGLSLIVAAALVFAFKGQIRSLTDVSVSSLLLPQTVVVLVVVSVVVLTVSVIIPSVVYQKIPVSLAIRHYKDSKRKWKLALLFFQFSFSVILVSLVSVSTAQYRKSLTADLGYKYDRLVYFYTSSDGEDVVKAIDRLKQLPEIEDIQTCSYLPLSYSNGNNVYLPDSDVEIMNVADQYFGSPGFFSLMEIDIKEGSVPQEPDDIAVSRSFADKLSAYASWEDGVIGKAVRISEHSQSEDDVFTICGIYDDYVIGPGTNRDVRPSVRFCSDFGGEYYNMYYMPYVLMKLHDVNKTSVQNINSALKEIFQDEDVEVSSYSDAVEADFSSFKKLRNTFLIGCVFSLLIALLGLIGYVKDEANRRSAEMAIRKVNGATTFQLISLFIGTVLKIAVMAFVVGDVAAYFLSRLVLAQMPEKIGFVAGLILLSDLVLLIVLIACVVINSLGISRANPVDSIKTE